MARTRSARRSVTKKSPLVKSVPGSVHARSSKASANVPKVFTYRPVRKPDYFRYFVLEPGTKRSLLRGRLVTCKIATAPPYDAISYAWGSSVRSHKLICNGCLVPITSSLNKVLRQVRYRDESHVVWVDQLCINQEDEAEKGHQVGLMAEVYRGARKVLMCLGGSKAQGIRLTSLISEIRDVYEEDVRNRGESVILSSCKTCLPEGFMSDPRFEDLAIIMRHGYWRRLWAIQEIGLARCPKVCVGSSHIDWHIFLESIQYLMTHKRSWLLTRGFSLSISHMYTLEGWGSVDKRHLLIDIPTNSLDLLKVVSSCRWLDVSDERDRIYALLGHPVATLPSGEPIILPDYTINARDCLRRFTTQYIQKTGDLTILAMTEWQDNMPESGSASWVPSWNGPRVVPLAWWGTYDASRDLPRQPVLSGDVLHVKGVAVDVISDSWDILAKKARDRRSFRIDTVKDPAIEVWKMLQRRGKVYTDGRSRLATFLCSLLRVERPGPPYIIGLIHCVVRIVTLLLDSMMQQAAREMPPVDHRVWSEFTGTLDTICWYRRFICTPTSGIMGLVPEAARAGDVCTIIAGCRTPIVLRRENRGYRVVGEAFLYGFMNGQVSEWLKDGRAQLEEMALY
ncbi:uncharacterized protein HMPREF1541_03432 [Cyphellophora europaea CBS 101466]|uniref:Heterokaryon incompatibility domain-containing protein n=1 Tax=Cyphellophora europaea (strain CBS 101466) TaxID=1220924 RepID=W2RYC4_CYPE1|nr:uncharacterized protein HMPREF1541_03432 [Cyphellophora europaea CBS 101466]ETN41496.1 hypothetical protein HMPREF1541_03432 [Cyphellophora europaea CBS 101466]